MTLTDFSGFDLAIGSVYAVRWFSVDDLGRLRGLHHRAIWKPGENVAECRKDEDTGWAGLRFSFTSIWSSTTNTTTTTTKPVEDEPLSEHAVKARVELKHEVPEPTCSCGFYAYAQGCDDSGYAQVSDAVCGIVECYGRTIIGAKGLRAEKARIVALATDSEKVRRLYPDAKFYGTRRNWRLQRVSRRRAMLRDFDIVQPVERTPETDPTFWAAS